MEGLVFLKDVHILTDKVATSFTAFIGIVEAANVARHLVDDVLVHCHVLLGAEAPKADGADEDEAVEEFCLFAEDFGGFFSYWLVIVCFTSFSFTLKKG